MIKLTLALLLITLAVGCQNDHSAEANRLTEISVTLKPSEFQVPADLWDQLELVYNDQSDTVRKSLTGAEIPKAFFPLRVILREKNHGVLGGRNYRISLPEGGGKIDLADYVHEGKGTFYVRFEHDLVAGKKDVPPRIFFISHSQEREIDGQMWGNGCAKFFNLTSFHNSQMKSHGYVVNATNQRYVSFLAGVFVLAAKIDGALMLSQVTLTDSRYPQLECH